MFFKSFSFAPLVASSLPRSSDSSVSSYEASSGLATLQQQMQMLQMLMTQNLLQNTSARHSQPVMATLPFPIGPGAPGVSPLTGQVHSFRELEEPAGLLYPEIAEFLTALEHEDPRRTLTQYITVFTDKDFFNINELADFSAEQMRDEFGLSRGNAEYLKKKVKLAMDEAHRKWFLVIDQSRE
jgi:hypothetical protein